MSGGGTKSILFVHSRKATFIQIDRDLLAERWSVRDWYQPGRVANVPGLVPALLRSDVVFAWFASWHSFWPITLAWLLRKPSVLITGGFDTAAMPEIGYGYQVGGLRKWASRWIMRRAGRVATNSHYSRREIERNVGLGPERVEVLHHGVPDPFGALPGGERERMALTVGNVLRQSFERKGHRPFLDAARLLPDVSFVLAGKWMDDGARELADRAPENARLTGWLAREQLDDLFRRASVYVQASAHEGFGLSVAEAMLAGCIPVVTDAGALPEVVGETGVVVESADPRIVARGIETALGMDDAARRGARERVLERFPMDRRRDGLWELVESAAEG